jgi:hypothetical protein
MSDPELRLVLELASDNELLEIENILFGTRYTTKQPVHLILLPFYYHDDCSNLTFMYATMMLAWS